MPNPKRRHSKTRTAKRRTHDALDRAGRRACARSATSRRRLTASARTAATTASARSGRSTRSRLIASMIRIAVDAMGGDHAPRRSSTARWPRPVTWTSRSRSSAQPAARGGARSRIPTGGDLDAVRSSTRQTSSRWPSSRRGAAPQAARLDSGGRRSRRAPGGGRAVQRRPHRRDGDGGARRVRHDCRASIVRRWPRRSRRARGRRCCSIGANVECRPQHLLQFAIMGSVYARLALGVERPRVGLLSIGEEETKGTS